MLKKKQFLALAFVLVTTLIVWGSFKAWKQSNTVVAKMTSGTMVVKHLDSKMDVKMGELKMVVKHPKLKMPIKSAQKIPSGVFTRHSS